MSEACWATLQFDLDSETFSERIQSIGCDLEWVTIGRDSEAEHLFYPVRQFRRICTGYLWRQIGSILTNLSLRVSSGCYCTSTIVGSRVYGNTLSRLLTHSRIVWTVKSSTVRTSVLAVLSVRYYST